jgi:hypothetical protein
MGRGRKHGLAPGPRVRPALVLVGVVLVVLSGLGSLIAVPHSGLASSPIRGSIASPSHAKALIVQPRSNFTGPGNWTEQLDYGAASGNTGSGGISVLGTSCVSNASYAYCVGGQNSTGTDLSDVFVAHVSSSGTVDAWNETTDYGAASGTSGSGGLGVEFTSCVAYTGYIYCVAGATSVAPGTTSKVYYAPLLSTGVGAWTETTDYGAASGTTGAGGIRTFLLSCSEVSGYIFCVGDGSSKVFYASLSSSGVGAWTETTDFGAATGSTGSGGVAVSNPACVPNGTYIYCVGGTVSFKATSQVFFARANASGVAGWNETIDYAAGSGTTGSGGIPIYGTACFEYSGEITCVDGDNKTNVALDQVFYAALNSTGVGPWGQAGAYGDLPLATYHLSCVLIDVSFGLCASGATSQTYSAPFLYHPFAVTNLTTQLSATTLIVGNSFTDSATLQGATLDAGGTVTYVVFSDNDCSSDAGDNESGLASVNVTSGVVPNLHPWPTYQAGYYSVRASYSGDANNYGSVAPCEPLHTVRATTSLSTQLSTSTVAVGGSFSDSATLSGATPTAQGSVTYYLYKDGTCTTAVGQSSLQLVTNAAVPSSSAFTAVPSTASANSVLAVYSGDNSNTPTQAACEPLTVTPSTSARIAITCTPEGIAAGGSTTCTITLSGTVSPVAGELVLVSSESKTGTFTPSDCTLNSAGSCTVTYTDTTQGVPELKADYPGDGVNAAAIGTTVVGVLPTVSGTASATSTTTSGGSASADDTTTSGVSVTLSGTGAPDGTPVTIFTTVLQSLPTGVPAPPLAKVYAYYDVRVSGLSVGTANICIANSLIDATSVIAVSSPGGTVLNWTISPTVEHAGANPTDCANIPVSELGGTPFALGEPSSSSPHTSPSSTGISTLELAAAAVGILVVVGVVVVLWRRKAGGTSPPPEAPSAP